MPPGSDFEMQRQMIEGELAYIVWKGSSPKFDFPVGTDTFIIRGDKILYQTFAAKIDPK